MSKYLTRQGMEFSPIKFVEWVRPDAESEFVWASRRSRVPVWCWTSASMPTFCARSKIFRVSQHLRPAKDILH